MSTSEPSNDVQPRQGCINCGNPVIVPGYKNALCRECRDRFIRYPVPLSIKLFAVAVLAVLVLSMMRLSKNLSAGIHLKRGKRAERQSNYLTAQREYEKVIKLVPGVIEAQGHLLLASYYNNDLETMLNMSKELQGKNIEDDDLYQEMSSVIEDAGNYFPSDSFNLLLQRYRTTDSIPDELFKKYIRTNPAETFPIVSYASLLFNDNQYKSCDSLLDIAAQQKKGMFSILALKPPVKRELGQFDSAMYYCDQLLAINHENVYIIASKARTFLKQNKDKEGLEWAMKAHQIDNREPYTLATMALAYHLMNNAIERDKLIAKADADSTAATYMKYIKDVMTGKEKFR